MDLRRLSTTLDQFETDDQWDIPYLLQNAKLLERFDLFVGGGRSIAGILSPGARNLKVLDLEISFFHINSSPLWEICKELEAFAGHNLLETLSFVTFLSNLVTEDSIGSLFQEMETVLVKPGWSMLRQVSFKVSITPFEGSQNLSVALQSLPDKYLKRLSKHESIAFDYAVFK